MTAPQILLQSSKFDYAAAQQEVWDMGEMTDDMLAEEERLAFDGWDDRLQSASDDDARFHTPMHGNTNDLSPRRRFYASTQRPQRRLHPLDDPQLVRAFLDQGKVWCMGAQGGPDTGDIYRGSGRRGPDGITLYVSIDEMEPSHALNTARFILRRAREIAMTVEATGEWPKVHGISIDADDESECRHWLRNTPLVQALLRRAGEKQPAPGLPWEGIAS